MNLFIELIQVALGNRDKLSRNPSYDEWGTLFTIAQKQAVLGITFDALDHLATKRQKLPTNVFFEWIGVAEQIKHQNHIVNKRCVEVTALLADAGFKSCILKGQGNAQLYSNPLSRQPGDIDVWVDVPKDKIESFVREKFPDAEACYHHVDFPVFDDVDVEVHFTPTFSLVRRFQRKLDKYIENVKANQFENPIMLAGTDGFVNVPTGGFNIVYQLSHMYRHFFYGGLGLKQMIDFYYLLKKAYGDVDTDEINFNLRFLGLKNFSCAVMWIMKESFLVDDKYLINEPDIKRGHLVLNEIMEGGNFGHYDTRLPHRLMTKSFTLSIIMRNVRLFGYFPEETVMIPIDGVIREFKLKK